MKIVRQRLRELNTTALGRFGRQVSIMLVGTSAAQLITFLGTLVLTRQFSPDAFGVLGVFTAALAILGTLSTLRFEYAIPIVHDKHAKATVLLSLVTVIILTSSFAGMSLLGGPELLKALGVELELPFLLLLILAMLLVGTNHTFNYWAIRQKAFARIAKAKFSQGAGTTLLQILMGALNLGATGLVLGYALGRGIATLSLARGFNLFDVAKKELRIAPQLASRYRSFPLYGTPGTVLVNIGVHLPVIVLAAIFDPAVVGFFALCQRTILAIVDLVAGSVKQVFLGRAGRLVQSNPRHLVAVGLKMSAALFGLALPFATVLALFGPELFTFLFGDQWRQTGYYAQVLAPMLLIQFSIIPVAQLNILERQQTYFAWSLGRLLILGVSFFIAHALYSGNDVAVVAAYAIGNSFSLIALGGLWIIAVLRIGLDK